MTFFFQPLLLLVVLAALGVLRWRRPARPVVGIALLGTLVFGVGLALALAMTDFNFLFLRLMAWVLFLHLPLFGVGAAALFRRQARAAALLYGGLAVVMGLIGLDAFVIEPQWLEVSRVTITSAKLSRPVRVAVVADVQTAHPGAYEERVLRRVAAERPDLILFAGDYLQAPAAREANEARAFTALLRRVHLRAPLGVYAIAGNFEMMDLHWLRLFDGTGVTTCPRDATVDLGPLALTTLSASSSFNPHCVVAAQLAFHIALGHVPDYSLGDVRADVLLAGHVHGGQVRLPFLGPVLNPTLLPRKRAAGVSEIAPGKFLIVSRGIGMERGGAPQLRFLCRPELVILELQPLRR